MSEEYQIMLPKLGESIVSATVVQWFKKEGDAVLLDEPLLEVSTDKVNSEIPSPVAGVLERIVAKVDEEIQVGEMLAVVRRQGGTVSLPPTETVTPKEVSVPQEENKDYFSPAVLRVAAERGISLESLQKMKGTGSGGRITKQDVENFESSSPSPCPLQKSKAQEISLGEEERLKMTGIRKAIADNMVKSFYEAPHATLINEIDVTAIMKKIQAEKESFYTRYGVKLTVTSFVLQALAKALVEFPLLNSFLDKDTIVLKKYVNVGVAVSIEQGLIVPVVKNCQKMSLPEIAQHVHDLSEKARTGRLLPGDVLDGTITLTNFGMSGVSIGVPIIRYPEVAILGMGAIKKRVQVMEGDMLAIRSMLYFSLTFDHRVIDGMYGCSFLSSLQRHLQNP
jgi:2-oxoglutarate dehydrogenase E2 component (dihydrolipoamide succinyltransferase)